MVRNRRSVAPAPYDELSRGNACRTEGVRRCIILLDRDRAEYDGDDAESFERAIVAAASVVQSADRAGLTTRFVTSGGIDLRGPDVASNTLRVLAPIALGDPLGEVERDPGEGLGLVVLGH